MANFLLVLFLLGLSALLGKQIGFIQRYRIPPSLTGGILLLIFLSFFNDSKTSGFFLHLKSLPAEFIALVFACLFLQRSDGAHTIRRSIADVLSQTAFVWVAVMGQVVVGIIATVLVYKPFFATPMAFASVLETGFAGGHGTAVAMGPILVQNGIAPGLEYGLFSATVGFVLGIVGGVLLIHREHRRVATNKNPSVEQNDSIEISLHEFFITAMLIAAAYWLGVALKGVVEREILPRLFTSPHVAGFQLPLFAYTLVGGFSIKTLCSLAGLQSLIDNRLVLLYMDIFLEIMIFAGIAIIDVRLLGQSLVPLLSLFALGFLWNLFCHFYLRPRILPTPYSFEIGLMNFGMLNGTAATGLMLLKMVDPKLATPAARVFAESAALTQPFIAGGLLTLLTPYILTHLNPWLSLALYGSLLTFWLALGIASGRKILRRA